MHLVNSIKKNHFWQPENAHWPFDINSPYLCFFLRSQELVDCASYLCSNNRLLSCLQWTAVVNYLNNQVVRSVTALRKEENSIFLFIAKMTLATCGTPTSEISLVGFVRLLLNKQRFLERDLNFLKTGSFGCELWLLEKTTFKKSIRKSS